MHAADREVGFSHLIRQRVNLASSVAKDDSLCNCQSIVEVAEGVKLPFLLLNCNKVLLQALQCQLITLDQNADWIGHELCRHV